MSRIGAHTPISDEEATEWATRMVRDAEEMELLYNKGEWEEFVHLKLGIERGSFPSPAQRKGLVAGAENLWGDLGFAGVKVRTFEIRGVTQKRIVDSRGVFRSWDYVRKSILHV